MNTVTRNLLRPDTPSSDVMRRPIRDILAVVTSTAPWARSARVGVHLAARWDSALSACLVVPALHGFAAAAECDAVGRHGESSIAAKETAGAADFTQFAQRHGIAETHWVVASTNMVRTLRELGTWHDLAILEHDIVEPDGPLESLFDALLACRIPCLVLSPACDPAPQFARIAIEWNGSIEAIRAMHAALPLLLEASEVHLLGNSLCGSWHDGAGMACFDPVDYLARRGVSVIVHDIRADSPAVGEALLEQSGRVRAELLVVDAYAPASQRERICGDVTRHALMHADIPVLMHH